MLLNANLSLCKRVHPKCSIPSVQYQTHCVQDVEKMSSGYERSNDLHR